MKPLFRPVLLTLAAALLAIPVPAQTESAPMRLKTVVIDPGHGGKDPGCVSRDGKLYEKTVTLDVGKRLAHKIKAYYPEVEVKMTRTDDRFVELENRAVFANKAGANLFISIHVNSIDGSTSANGYSIHCLGQSSRKGTDLFSKNLDLVKRENSVIKLEKDYAATYQGFDPDDPQSSIIFSLMQNAHLGQSLEFAADVEHAMGKNPIRNSRGVSQDPFWVLWRTAMPSVLVELGFITNPDDLAILRTEEGRDALANNLLKAFGAFKARYDGEEAVAAQPEAAKPEAKPAAVPVAPAPKPEAPSASPKSEAKPAPKPAEPAPEAVFPADSVTYGIQILVTSKALSASDPFFCGYKAVALKTGSLNKYVVETSASLSEVRQKMPEVQKKFPDCYLVKIQNGSTSPVR